MANIQLLAINRTTQDSTVINPDSDASTGLKISTWEAPAGEEAYGLQVALPTVTGGASNAYSIYSEGPMSFKDNLGKIILSTVGTTSSSSYTLSLPRQTSTLATIDDVIAARNGLDVHDSVRVATTAEIPWTNVVNYAGQSILSAGAPSASSEWDPATTGVSPSPKPFVFAQRMNPGKSGSGLRIIISTVDSNGQITAATISTTNRGTNYKNGDMRPDISTVSAPSLLNATGTAATYTSANPTFGTATNPLTATNNTEWIVFIYSSGGGSYSNASGYIVPAGVGDFMNPGVNRAGNDTGYAVTIKGSQLGGDDGTNDLTFSPQYQPSIIRVDPLVSSGTPAYFLVTVTTNGVVYGIQLIHGGSGFTRSSSVTWATTNINGHLAAHKTATAGSNTVLGMVVATDPSAIRRVWFIKNTFSSSSTAVLGTPYYPKTSNGYGMYANYTTNQYGTVANIYLASAGTGYLTNDVVHAGIPQPIQYGVSTGKMNFSLDMPEGRGVTGSINITGGVPGVSTTISVVSGGTAGNNATAFAGNKTFSNVPCTIVSGTEATLGASDGKFTVHTTASAAQYTDLNTKIVVVVPPTGAAPVGGGATTIKILGTALGTNTPGGDLTFTYTKTIDTNITVLTGGLGFTPNTTTTTPVSISPGTDLPMMWYLPSPESNTSYHTIVECAVSPYASPDIYFEGATAVWKIASTIDPFVLSSRSAFPGSGLQLTVNSSSVASVVPGGGGDWYRLDDKIYLHSTGTGPFVTVNQIDNFRGIEKGPVLGIAGSGDPVTAASLPNPNSFSAPFLATGNPNNTGSFTIPISIPSEYTSSVSIISTVSGFRSNYITPSATGGIAKIVTADAGHYFQIALHNAAPINFATKTAWTWTGPSEGLNGSTGFSERPTATLSGFIKPSGPPSAQIDGVTVEEGNRILVKNQTTLPNALTSASTNGIYIPTYAKLNPYVFQYTRASDFNSSIATTLGSQVIPAEVSPNAFVFVEEGTANKDSGWTCTTDAPITLGTSNITWAKFTGASGVAEDQTNVNWTGTHTFSYGNGGKYTYFGTQTNWIYPNTYLELHSDSVLKLSANNTNATTRMNLGSSGVDNIFGSATAANGFEMKFIRTKGGDANTYAAVSADDTLGKLSFKGYTGTAVANTLEAASIVATAKGTTVSTIKLGGSLSFFTAPSADNVVSQERLRIDEAGAVTINGVSANINNAAGTANLLTNVTSGSVNLFTSVTNASDGINIGGTGSQVTIGTTGGNSSLNIKGSTTSGTATLTTNAATGYLFNTSATSISLGGSATAITMGASSGTVTINNPTVTMANGGTFNMNGPSNVGQVIETSTIDSTASIFNGTLIAAGKLFGRTTAISIGSAKIPGTTTNPQTVGIGGTTVNAVPLVAPTLTTQTGGTVSYVYAYTAVYPDGSESIPSPVSAYILSTSTPNNTIRITNITNAYSYNLYRTPLATPSVPTSTTTWQKINVNPIMPAALPAITTDVVDTAIPTTPLAILLPAQHSSVIGQSSYQLGFSANASTTRGRFSLASGGFAAEISKTIPIPGSSQMSTYVLSAYTNAVSQQVVMTTDWVGTAGTAPTPLNQIIIKQNSAYAFSILVSISASGDSSQGSMGTAGATIITEGVISRTTGAATIQGGSVISRCQSNLFVTLGCNTTNAPSITLVDGDSNGVFAIQAKSNTGSTLARSLRWTAVVTMSECG